MIGLLGFVALIGGAIAYRQFLESGLKRREGVSSLTEDDLRALFEAKVARLGWSVVDDDNPMVAQSGLLMGRRQQISLDLTPVEGGVRYQIWPSRFWRKGLARTPYKAHTLRIRMNSFVNAVGGGIAPEYGENDWHAEVPLQARSRSDLSALANTFAVTQSAGAYDELVDALLQLRPTDLSPALSDAIGRFEFELRARRSTTELFASVRQIAMAAAAA